MALKDVALIGLVMALGLVLSPVLMQNPGAGDVIAFLTALGTLTYMLITTERYRFAIGAGVGGAIISALIMGVVTALIAYIIDLFVAAAVAGLNAGAGLALAIRMLVDGLVTGWLASYLLLVPE